MKMTNEEIIKFLQSKQIPQCGDKEYTADEEYEAYQRAIDALEQEPCEDVISRENAIIQLSWDFPNLELPKIKESLDKLPLVTPQQKYGKWIKTKLSVSDGSFNVGVRCSRCGYVTVVDDFNFCPNCGSAMKDGRTLDEFIELLKQKQEYGKWIKHPEIETSTPEYLMFYECSECGDKQCFYKSDLHKKRFCSNCGTKMQESEEV